MKSEMTKEAAAEACAALSAFVAGASPFLWRLRPPRFGMDKEDSYGLGAGCRPARAAGRREQARGHTVSGGTGRRRRQGRLGESDRAFDLVRTLPTPIRVADVARVTGWGIARARAWLYRHVHADALAWCRPGEAVRTPWYPGGGGADAVGVKDPNPVRTAAWSSKDLERAEALLDKATANGNSPLAEIMEFRVRKLRRETSA